MGQVWSQWSISGKGHCLEGASINTRNIHGSEIEPGRGEDGDCSLHSQSSRAITSGPSRARAFDPCRELPAILSQTIANQRTGPPGLIAGGFMDCRRMSAITCSVTVSATVLVFTGCTRKHSDDAPLSAPAPAASAPAAELPASAGAAAPAESSLSIKRGMVSTAGDHAIFRACDEKADLWLVDESEGALTQLLTEGAVSAYVEGYGERAPVPDDIPAARGHAGVFILEQLLYAGIPGEGAGCAKPAPDYVVAARGNEPFWSAQVTDTGMVWKQPEAPQEIVLSALQSQDSEGTVSYRASADGHQLELLIDAQACRDAMSGEYFAYAARAVLDGRQFKGCAHVGK